MTSPVLFRALRVVLLTALLWVAPPTPTLAGGVVTDTSGRPLDDTCLGLERTSPFIAAANRQLLDKALKVLIKQ